MIEPEDEAWRKMFILEQNCSSWKIVDKGQKQQKNPGETSSWVSTSIWEPLPISDQQKCFFIFICKPNMHVHDE